MKNYVIKESQIRKVVNQIINEEEQEAAQRCTPNNTLTLSQLVGDSSNFKNYTKSINRRTSGVKGLIDSLEILKSMRLMKNEITDGGEHLGYDIYTLLVHLKKYNYFDEVNKTCVPALEKVKELYSEDKYGEELTKDIEKVLRYDEELAPKTKEYLKGAIGILKGK